MFKRAIHFLCIIALVQSLSFNVHSQTPACQGLFSPDFSAKGVNYDSKTTEQLSKPVVLIEKPEEVLKTIPEELSTAKKIFRALLTFPIPFIPIYNSIRDTNKRFFIFVESPTISMFSSMVGVQLARFFSPSTSSWLGNFLDSFIPFTIVSTARNGVALENQYTPRQKYWLGYLYSVGFYSLVSIITAGAMTQIPDVMMNLKSASPEQITKTAYAIGLVGFSFAWPLLTSKLQTDILPNYLFGRFLQLDEMKSIQPYIGTHIPRDSKLKALSEFNLKLKNTLENFNAQKAKSDINAKELRLAEMAYKGALHRYYWAKWRLIGLSVGDINPLNGKPVRKEKLPISASAYWFLKSAVTMGVSVSIIIPYFIARNWSIGTGVEDIGLLTNQIINALLSVKDAQISEIGNLILTTTPPDILQEYGLN